jgi:hypothetical protein
MYVKPTSIFSSPQGHPFQEEKGKKSEPKGGRKDDALGHLRGV